MPSRSAIQDLRLAIRSLRATPIVTCVAVVSLALGIGANTAIFSLVNALLLRALPVREPGRLFQVSTAAGSNRLQFSYATFAQIRDQVEAFDGAFGYTPCCGKSIVGGGGVHAMADRQFVTGEFFQTLGVHAYRGRLLTPADDTAAPPDGPVAVVSYRYWCDHLEARDAAVGAPLTIDGTLVTIVGVTPPDFFGVDVGRSFDVIAPYHLAPRMTSSPFDDDTVWLNIIVRARRGIDGAAMTTALRGAQPQIRAAATPKKFPNPMFLHDPFTLEPAATGISTLRERFERPLAALFVVVALVLLIACANVGNLLLARGSARRHELSVRVAIGASRWQLARQVMVESLVLASVGSAVGLLLASWATRLLLSELSNPRAPLALDAAVDGRVLAFASGAAVATALLFGAAPALRATAVAPIDALRSHGRSAATERAALSSGVTVLNVALSLLLVVAAGLFVQTFQRLARVPLGFDPDRTLVVSITASTVPASERGTLVDRLARRVAAVPGVQAAGGALNPPIIGEIGGADLVISAPGSLPPPDAPRISHVDLITPHWFAAYGVPIEAGRDFDDRDLRDGPPVMIVNDAFVRRLFPGRSVTGMVLSLAWRIERGDVPYGTRTIVGVAADSVYHTIREPVQPMIFLPLVSRDPLLQKDFYLGVRASAGSPALLERRVASAISAVSPEVAFSFEPLTQALDESLADNRVIAVLSASFGVLALVLAAVGLYGVTAYGVAQRRTEIGIRMALGARPGIIVRTIVANVSKLVGIGVAAGIGISLWTATLVRSLLFGLEPRDPTTLVGAVIVLATAATVAGWLPAWRASRIDPAEVLRES
jgi:putative ABC transport system permease protein